MSRERPILFSGPMVRAILDGRKTQTRRIVKLDGPKCATDCTGVLAEKAWRDPGFGDGEYLHLPCKDGAAQRVYCPYGVPGDGLWVRETFAVGSVEGSTAYLARAERMPAGKTLADTDGGLDERRDLSPEEVAWAEVRAGSERWIPGIHMPRWASRLLLEVTEVRVQRLQETTEADARAEGIVLRDAPDQFSAHSVVAVDGKAYLSVGSAWAALWDSINGKRAPWSSNPWVWALSFKRAA